MRRSRINKKYVESSESEDEKLLKKQSSSNEVVNNIKDNNESSSESDIEDYLLKPEKLNLDSQFFTTKNVSEFERVEQNIFGGVSKLSDSESEAEEENEEIQNENTFVPLQSHTSTSTKMNFKHLQDYTKQIEEAKKHIEIYKAKKKAGEQKSNIHNLLAAGERKSGVEESLNHVDLHSSDFESCDSEQEDWEEIKTKPIEENQAKNLLPQSSLQITVDMPTNVKKKKGLDLIAAMKRRLNRIRKENQILVHKVHLLCWLAHGNYVSSSINDTETLATALSLLPSEQCYPSDRVDLSYLEQIVKWYKRTVKNIEKPVPQEISLDKCLQLQIGKKEAYNKKMLVCIFIAILRALGIQTRIVMSLQVEPLRPPLSDLHTVSTKSSNQKEIIKQPAGTSKNKSNPIAGKQSKNSVAAAEEKDKEIEKKATKKPNGNKKLDISNKPNLKSGKSIKPQLVKEPTTETGFNNVKINSKQSKGLPGLSSKETLSDLPISNPKAYDVNARKNKKPTIKTEEKISEVKTAQQKSIRSKILLGDNKDFLTTGKLNQLSNSKGSQNTLNISKTTKCVKLGEGKNFERSVRMSTRQGTNKVEENDKTNLTSKKNVKRLKSTEHKDSIKSEELVTKKTRREQLQKTLENTKYIEPIPSTSKTQGRIKSSELKDSTASVSGTSKSKSIENKNNKRTLRTKINKNISQVDGIDDSDSDMDMTIQQLDGSKDTKKQSKSQAGKKSSGRKKSTQNAKETDSESEFEPTSPLSRKRLRRSSETYDLNKLRTTKHTSSVKHLDVRNDVMNLVKGRITEQKLVDQSRLAKKGKRNLENNSDSDYAPEPIRKKYHDSDDDFVPKVKVKKRVQVARTSVLSDSDNELDKNKKRGNDVWLEVFLEAEEKWISVDVIYGQVHCVKEIYQRATHPVSYVVAWDNNNKLKDISQRYCQNFNTITRKQRIDSNWWNDSLKPFMGIRTARDKEEDDDLARQQLDQPLPKAISEYKNHPLYALRRHLLKFEALYPSEAPTLGFIRGEAVYPRSCVYTLHSRDIWLKQAKVVKLGEQPYKIVKARPKYDRLSNRVLASDQTLDIFGLWQVQDYEPPTAENGIVPKNAFGNVDLFKSCMLPKGCVHLKLPGLNKIARRMNIDVASAIVGFDFHGGWSHPVYDGFVACSEFEDQLICAWELEQDELDRKEEEKIDKRVYGNWKKLIRGLLIRERLKAKYDFGEPSTSNVKDKKNKVKSKK